MAGTKLLTDEGARRMISEMGAKNARAAERPAIPGAGLRPIRLIQLLPNLAVGGRERMVASLVRTVDRDRFRPEVVLFDFSGSLASEVERDGIPVTLARRKSGFLDLSLVRTLAEFFRGAPSIVHTHGTTAMIYGALAGRIAGVPVVATEHGRNNSDPWHDRLLHEIAASLVSRHVAVSEALRNGIAARDLREHAIEVVRNGIDPAPFVSATRALARRRLDLDEKTFVGVAVARLVPLKNHDLLFASWRKVLATVPDAALLVVGTGPEMDRLQELASTFPRGTIRMLGERQDVPDLLAASDVNLLSSRSEGLSITLIEALAAGIPSIATDVGGNREIINDGVTGILVRSRNPDDFAGAILMLAATPERRKSMGRTASASFGECFNVRAMARSYESIYQSLIR